MPDERKQIKQFSSNTTGESDAKFYVSGIYNASSKVGSQQNAKEVFRALADKLTKDHPAISTNPHIFGGIPHIKDVRLSVGDVLAKLYTYGSIQEILDSYAPQVSEEQIKEAIAYAQDFLEIACDPDEPSEIDD